MCERQINQLPLAHHNLGTWPTSQVCALTGNRISDLLVRRPALNPLSHTSQGFINIKTTKRHHLAGMDVTGHRQLRSGENVKPCSAGLGPHVICSSISSTSNC